MNSKIMRLVLLLLATINFSSSGFAQIGTTLFVPLNLSHGINEDTSGGWKLPYPITFFPNNPDGTKAYGTERVKRLKIPINGTLYLKHEKSAFWQSTNDYFYYPSHNFRGTDYFSFEYHDGTAGGKTYRVHVSITVASVNDAPTIWAPSKLYTQPGRSMEASVYIKDADNEALTVTASNLPQGATFDQSNYTIKWTPGIMAVGTYNVRISAKDALTEAVRNIPIEVVAQRSPRRVFYDGTTFGFAEGIGWDTSGSIARQGLSGTNNYIAFTINNRNYWGAAGYSFAPNSYTDLSAYGYLKFDIWSSPNANAIIYLVDYYTGKESIKKTVNLKSAMTSFELNLDELAAQGFDTSKTTSLIVATSNQATITYNIGLDNIVAEGRQTLPLPLAFEPYVEIIADAGANQARIAIPNLGSKTISKVTWTMVGMDTLFPDNRSTTTTSIGFDQYKACDICSLRAAVEIEGKAYATVNDIRIPYIPLAPVAPTIIDMNVDTDVFLTGFQTKRQYKDSVVNSWLAKKGLPPTGFALTGLKRELLWERGLIPYTISGLTSLEIANVEIAMNNIYNATGIAFVSADRFFPKDSDLTKPPVMIRLMSTNDFMGSSEQKAALLKTETCKVNGLGINASLVLLKRADGGVTVDVETECLSSANSVADLKTIRHELLHVLGVAHEQKAPTATGYVNLSRVYPWEEAQFIAGSDEDLVPRTEFDPESIMLYSRFAFSICKANAKTGTGNPVWTYAAIDPAKDKIFQDRLDTLTYSPDPNLNCRRNAVTNATTLPSCQAECQTISSGAADSSVYTNLSLKDVAGLKKMYPLNNLFLDARNTLATNMLRIEAANTLGSVKTILKELSLNQSLTTTSLPHRVVAQMFKNNPTTRAVQFSEGCTTGATSIIEGRKSCNVSSCIGVSSDAASFIPTLEVKSITKLGEAQCSGAYSNDGKSFCIAANARGSTTNGSMGFISCRYTLYEVDL